VAGGGDGEEGVGEDHEGGPAAVLVLVLTEPGLCGLEGLLDRQRRPATAIRWWSGTGGGDQVAGEFAGAVVAADEQPVVSPVGVGGAW
jgi:hypothetical protein